MKRGFNPRAPRGARPAWLRGAERRGGFQSTRPARGATVDRPRHPQTPVVSIHAPRAGRDRGGFDEMAGLECFNPRAPRGARPGQWAELFKNRGVSIHAPRAGRDLLRACAFRLQHLVSIHAPRAGRDRTERRRKTARTCFNPRAPRGARLCAGKVRRTGREFQSTRPARGATGELSRISLSWRVSIHAPRAGRDTRCG